MMLNKRNRRISKIVTYALLVIFSLYCIFPFIWMLISALKPKTEIFTGYWWMPDFYDTLKIVYLYPLQPAFCLWSLQLWLDTH